jgi:RecB family exonuclease
MGMAKRKPARPAKRPDRRTLVHRLYQDILKQRSALTHPCPDKEMNAGLELLASLTTSIANAPAETATDVRLKVEVLCARLREHLHPENEGELLDYLLADSIRDDLLMVLASAEPDVKRS